MTRILFKKEKNFWTYLEVNGHSGYANYGEDIVCAGISTSVIMSINLLYRIIPDCFEVLQNNTNGYICLQNIRYNNINKSEQKFIDQIFENLKDYLLKMQVEYPKNLKIKIENN